MTTVTELWGSEIQELSCRDEDMLTAYGRPYSAEPANRTVLILITRS
jgi:hypothetical protein